MKRRAAPVLDLLGADELEAMRTGHAPEARPDTSDVDLAATVERAWHSHSGEPTVVAAAELAKLRRRSGDG